MFIGCAALALTLPPERDVCYLDRCPSVGRHLLMCPSDNIVPPDIIHRGILSP